MVVLERFYANVMQEFGDYGDKGTEIVIKKKRCLPFLNKRIFLLHIVSIDKIFTCYRLKVVCFISCKLYIENELIHFFFQHTGICPI